MDFESRLLKKFMAHEICSGDFQGKFMGHESRLLKKFIGHEKNTPNSWKIQGLK